MVLQMLLLLEGLVAAFEGAFEHALVAFQVPVKLALADKLPVSADWALKL